LPEVDTILAALSGGIALAGLLLIFSGFLITKAASFETKRGDKFVWFARATLIPVLSALALSWLSIDALQGNPWALAHLIGTLKLVLGITAAFAVVGVLASS
jgi:hypothetical protein